MTQGVQAVRASLLASCAQHQLSGVLMYAKVMGCRSCSCCCLLLLFWCDVHLMYSMVWPGA
jgi:hypothetical protein